MLRIKITEERAIQSLLKSFPTMDVATVAETERSYIIALVPKGYDFEKKGPTLQHPFEVLKDGSDIRLYNPLHDKTKLIKPPRRVLKTTEVKIQNGL